MTGDLFLLATVIAAIVWIAVLTLQRNEARAEVERLEAENAELDQENIRLHSELTEAQIASGVVIPFPSLPPSHELSEFAWPRIVRGIWQETEGS